MNELIIDAASNNIFLMVIKPDGIYNVSHKNSKTNYERLVILIDNLLNSSKLKMYDISAMYINRGPGSYAGIRNSLAVAKAIHLTAKIDYFCYSFEDFVNEKKIKHEKIPKLCNKFAIKKNLINPIYRS